MGSPFDHFEDSPLDHFKQKRTGTQFDLAEVEASFTESGYYKGGIDQDLLIADLSSAQGDDGLLEDFYYKEYRGAPYVKDWPINPLDGQEKTTKGFVKTGINTRNDYSGDDLNNFATRLNTKVGGTVIADPTYRVIINLDSSYAHYLTGFHFADGTPESPEDEAGNVVYQGTNPEIEGRRTRRLLAIEFSTTTYEEFVFLGSQFGQELSPYVKKAFLKAYAEINQENLKKMDLDEFAKLNHFYQQVPVEFLLDYTLEDLSLDFMRLLIYDAERWLYDNSHLMLKVLGAVIAKPGGLEYLYQSMTAYPELVKNVYHHLDKSDTSQYVGGQLAPNKTIFAAMCTLICNAHFQSNGISLANLPLTFNIREGHRVDSNIYDPDTKPGKYNLTQQRKAFVPMGLYELGPGSVSESDEWPNERPTDFLAPLEMVNLITDGPNGEQMVIQVPAIFVKDLAYQREWAEVETFLRIVVDILVIAVSIVTLAGAPNAFLATLSVIDLGLGVIDVSTLLFREEIMQLEGGPEFLEAWDKVYLVGGVITGLPFLGVLLKKGFSLLSKVATLPSRVQLVGMLKVILEQSRTFTRFVKGAFEIVVDYVALLGGTIAKTMDTLASEGAYLIRLGKGGAEKYALAFKEAILHSGSLTEIKTAIRRIAKNGKQNLGWHLRRLYMQKVGSGYGIEYIPGTRKESKTIFRQELESSCAAATVRQICKDFKIYKTEKEVRELLNTVTDGSKRSGTLLHQKAPVLQELFRKFGKGKVRKFKVKSTRVKSIEEGRRFLKNIKTKTKHPWLASLGNGEEGLHSVIVDEVVGDVVKIRDPTGLNWEVGPKGWGVKGEMELDRFLQIWEDSSFHNAYYSK